MSNQGWVVYRCCYCDARKVFLVMHHQNIKKLRKRARIWMIWNWWHQRSGSTALYICDRCGNDIPLEKPVPIYIWWKRPGPSYKRCHFGYRMFGEG